MLKKQWHISWTKSFDEKNFRGGQGYSIRRVDNNRTKEFLYEISVSPKRKSWYTGFDDYNRAKKFASKGFVWYGGYR